MFGPAKGPKGEPPTLEAEPPAPEPAPEPAPDETEPPADEPPAEVGAFESS